MRSRNRAPLIGIPRFLGVISLLLPSVSAWGQTVVATVPVGINPVAIALNPMTNKIYVANCVPSGANAINGTVTVIDGYTNATATVPVGICPSAVAVNPATNKIYVANFGHMSFSRGLNYGSLTVIDGGTDTPVNVTDSKAKFPRAVALNPITNKIYIANRESSNVTVIDGWTNAITTVPTVVWPYDLAVNPVTNKIYVTSFGPYPTTSMAVIDGTTGHSTTVTDQSAVNPTAVAVNHVTNKIYVANLDNCGDGPCSNVGSVTVIDGGTDSTTHIVDPNAFGPHALAVDPVSNKIYVANSNTITKSGDGGVTVINGSTNSFVHVTDPHANTMACPFTTANVAADPATGKIYVANSCSNNVTVIDEATNSTTTVGNANATSPTAIAVNPATHRVYVVNSGSNNVTVIDGE